MLKLVDYSSSDDEGTNSVEEHLRHTPMSAFPIEFFSCSKNKNEMKLGSNNMDSLVNSDESNSDDDFMTLNVKDRIQTFEDFTKRLKSLIWSKNWNVYEQPDGIFIYKLSREPNSSKIEVSINLFINKDMQVKLHKNDVKDELEMLLKDSKLELWSQFYSILNHYNLDASDQKEFTNALDQENQIKNVNFESTEILALDDKVQAEDVSEGEEEPITSLDTLKLLELDKFPLCRIKMLSKSDLNRIKAQQHKSSSSKR